MIQALWVAAVLLAWVSGVSAHPLGNNTVNRQAHLRFAADSILVDYLVDHAEVPTLLATQTADIDADGDTTADEWNAYVRHWAAERAAQLKLVMHGREHSASVARSTWRLLPGSAGLTTLRIEVKFRFPLRSSIGTFAYTDGYRPDEPGWKEIWVDAKPEIELARSTAATQDRSQRLTRFPADGLLSETHTEVRVVGIERPPATASTLTHVAGAAAQQVDADARSTAAAQVKQPLHEQTGVVAQENRDRPKGSAADGRSPIAGSVQGWSFFKLGAAHVAHGWDHLIFLCGLLLSARGVRKAVHLVTAFTLAHCFTLLLAAHGWVSAPTALTEQAIALTIAFVGLSSLLRSSSESAWLAFAFGLVHGVGFAGALSAAVEQSPRAHVIPWLLQLLNFNLGIEAFQLAAILAAIPILHWIARQSWGNLAQRLGSLAIFAAGTIAFVARISA